MMKSFNDKQNDEIVQILLCKFLSDAKIRISARRSRISSDGGHGSGGASGIRGR